MNITTGSGNIEHYEPRTEMKQTPEQKAEARYPGLDSGIDRDMWHMIEGRREGYATCIREEVEPLEAEVERLRALGDAMWSALRRAEQDLIDWKRQGIALRGESEEGVQRGIQGCIPSAQGIEYTDKVARHCYDAFMAWDNAKEQGFAPTNTEDQ